jgi:hypothetical protein
MQHWRAAGNKKSKVLNQNARHNHVMSRNNATKHATEQEHKTEHATKNGKVLPHQLRRRDTPSSKQ